MAETLKIYVASSWRNDKQPEIVKRLFESGYQAYDFRNPPSGSGFSWSEVSPEWQSWDTEQYKQGLEHPRAVAGFSNDLRGMLSSDVCILLLPCGRSAHAEAGYMAGSGKPVIVFIPEGEKIEPELMYNLFEGIVTNFPELLDELNFLKVKLSK